jgi:signal transduction histidine kinase
MERLYADLDLPALRHAIDPRNASRPVLLRGEPGTRRGLVAQYIHQLAEPRREALIVVPAAAVRPGEAERRVLEPTAGRRVTLVLQGIDEADDAVQRELAHLLGESGSQGVESLRWIATARPRRLRGALRDVPWLEVDLPPLRHRPDLPRLARAVAAERARLARRAIELSDTALERLAAYAWPRNLRELEQTLDRSVQACPGDRLDADGLLFAPPGRGRRKPHAWVEERPARGSAEPERIRAADESAPPPSAEPLVTEPAEEVSEAEAPLTTTPPPPALLSAAVRELKGPLLALRAQAHLGAQPRSDPAARADLGATREGELAEIEQTLRRLEAFASFGPPRIEPVDVAACARSELDQRQNAIHKRSIVVLRELDADAPRARADAVQLRFAIGALFDRALRMVPEGGDLYVASRRRAGPAGEPAAHRLMIRFHSPEEVLGGPEDLPGTAVHLEVLLARSLVERMGGEFAADTSGAQDNVVLIELPI